MNKIFEYILKKIHGIKLNRIMKKYEMDTKSYEKGATFGYQKGFIDGTELRAQRSEGVPAEEYNGLVRYLVTHNLEIYYCLNSPAGTGLKVRYKEKIT